MPKPLNPMGFEIGRLYGRPECALGAEGREFESHRPDHHIPSVAGIPRQSLKDPIAMVVREAPTVNATGAWRCTCACR